jgi:hypothetical protein
MAGNGSIATGRGKLQVQPCPQCPVSDGRSEKGGLSRWATSGSDQPHSITSSARPSKGNGTFNPSAFAIFRLMTSSTFVDC